MRVVRSYQRQSHETKLQRGSWDGAEKRRECTYERRIRGELRGEGGMHTRGCDGVGSYQSESGDLLLE